MVEEKASGSKENINQDLSINRNPQNNIGCIVTFNNNPMKKLFWKSKHDITFNNKKNKFDGQQVNKILNNTEEKDILKKFRMTFFYLQKCIRIYNGITLKDNNNNNLDINDKKYRYLKDAIYYMYSPLMKLENNKQLNDNIKKPEKRYNMFKDMLMKDIETWMNVFQKIEEIENDTTIDFNKRKKYKSNICSIFLEKQKEDIYDLFFSILADNIKKNLKKDIKELTDDQVINYIVKDSDFNSFFNSTAFKFFNKDKLSMPIINYLKSKYTNVTKQIQFPINNQDYIKLINCILSYDENESAENESVIAKIDEILNEWNDSIINKMQNTEYWNDAENKKWQVVVDKEVANILKGIIENTQTKNTKTENNIETKLSLDHYIKLLMADNTSLSLEHKGILKVIQPNTAESILYWSAEYIYLFSNLIIIFISFLFCIFMILDILPKLESISNIEKSILLFFISLLTFICSTLCLRNLSPLYRKVKTFFGISKHNSLSSILFEISLFLITASVIILSTQRSKNFYIFFLSQVQAHGVFFFCISIFCFLFTYLRMYLTLKKDTKNKFDIFKVKMFFFFTLILSFILFISLSNIKLTQDDISNSVNYSSNSVNYSNNPVSYSNNPVSYSRKLVP